MHPIEWLTDHVPGFNNLSNHERHAIMHFSLLWSLFEANALNGSASAKAISALVRQWGGDGRLDAAAFEEHLAYFKDRYFAEGAFNHRFEKLYLRPNDMPNIVKAVLSGQRVGEADTITALLIIVYRLRNNFFHGRKWAYNLHGQFGNFSHANAVLMHALELSERH
jgi:hypothetical protein